MTYRPKPLFQRSELPPDVGRALRTAREHAGRSRREVALATGIAARTLARIERGAQLPLWPTLDRLCDVLGVSAFTVARRWASQAMDLPESAVSAPGLGLRALRHARGMSLVELAERVGVSAATVSRFERGITASRLLARRVGGPDVDFDDRYVTLNSDRLAPAFGFTSGEAFEQACLAAFSAIGEPPSGSGTES